MTELKQIARLYSNAAFQVLEEIKRWDTENDKRSVFLLRFADGQALAVKVCRNAFTTPERIAAWQGLCRRYLALGIYCPQIVDTQSGSASEAVTIDGEDYLVYAEEMKKYPTCEEAEPQPDFGSLQADILESIGKVAGGCRELLPFPSVFCLYDRFDPNDAMDENLEHAQKFCARTKEFFPEHSAYADALLALLLQKRAQFEPVYRALPKASFQADLNPSNILVDENLKFAGYIDFNLSGAETVLSYLLINEVCTYRLQEEDIVHLADTDFRKRCDDYLYRNLAIVGRHYAFSAMEKEQLCLCCNTVYPFCCWTANGLMKAAGEAKNPQQAKDLLDWLHYQLGRDDIKI